MKALNCILITILALICIMPASSNGRRDTVFDAVGIPAMLPDICEPSKPIVQKDVYYKNAIPDYLDFELSSWERKTKVEYIMLHFTSAVVLNRKDPYNMSLIRSTFEKERIGINYIIDRDGTVYCWLPEERCAWHAGVGTWNNSEKYTDKMNLYSIGIELVAIGSKSDMSQYLSSKNYNKIPVSMRGYTESQYKALGELVYDLCARYTVPMTKDYIIGHEEYSPHKSDPGELFDWNKLFYEIKKQTA